MLIELFIKTFIVGLIDSMNQSAIAITIYLLSTSRPTRNVLFFVLGVIIAYTLAGILVFLGLGGFFFDVLIFSFKTQAVIGLIFGCIFLSIPIFNRQTAVKKRSFPKMDHPFLSLSAGAILTFLQVPIALPFLYLMQQLARTVSFQTFFAFLTTFNILVNLPLIALLIGYIVFHEKVKPAILRFGSWVDKNSTYLLNIGLYLLGIFLLVDSISYLSGKKLFQM